ncbi:MAG TPA: hypothetical protein VID48_02815 [Solirubrobacteraceae bacterium]|jgi:hypothetical protein
MPGTEGITKTYTLTDAPFTLGLADINHDGSVGLDDLTTGERVKAIGRITMLSRGATRRDSRRRPRSARSSSTSQPSNLVLPD